MSETSDESFYDSSEEDIQVETSQSIQPQFDLNILNGISLIPPILSLIADFEPPFPEMENQFDF